MAEEGNNQGKNLFGLSGDDRSALLSRLKRTGSASLQPREGRTLEAVQWRADPKMTKFDEFPAYKQLRMERIVAARAGILNPFFQCHDGR